MKKAWIILPAVFLLFGGLAMAQRFGGGRRFGGGGRSFDDGARTAREMPSGSTGTPEWTNPVGFEKDVFTFARVRYAGGRWRTDAPDSDLNFSYRLQQMTSLKVDPDGRIVNLTDPDLFHFPFIYIVEPGGLYLDETEVVALRKYLMNGGFLMLDDFWGDSAWRNVEQVMRQVFPNRSFVELPLEHPLYHCVFDIKAKSQVPAIGVGAASEHTGITWENHDGDCRTVHHRAISDDNGRIMVIATHNTDNGDGWEREGENHYYFKNFSEKIAYPLGINIIFYAMSH